MVLRELHVATTLEKLSLNRNISLLLPVSVGGIMVSIAAFQAVDPSSILGHRSIFFLIKFVSQIVFKLRFSKIF